MDSVKAPHNQKISGCTFGLIRFVNRYMFVGLTLSSEGFNKSLPKINIFIQNLTDNKFAYSQCDPFLTLTLKDGQEYALKILFKYVSGYNFHIYLRRYECVL